MGICHSTKNKFSSIGKETYCPKCNKYFTSKTTFYNLNRHLDVCLTQNPSPNLVFSDGISEINILNEIYANNSNDTNYFWVKIQKSDNIKEYFWEKHISKKLDKNEYLKLINLPKNQIISSDFENKKFWFYNQLEKIRIPWTEGSENLEIRKDFVLEDTITKLPFCDLHKELKITFKEDKVNDAGGLIREWISVIIKEICSKQDLFIQTDTKEKFYKINNEKSECFSRYFLLGNVIGKAIFERIPINFSLNHTIIKRIIGKSVELNDIITFDEYLFNSWMFILQNNINEINECFADNFTIMRRNSNNFLENIELIENGKNIKLDETSKIKFIQLSIEYYCYKSIQKQIDSLIEGIFSVIPMDLLEIFNIIEFEMILNGIPIIDIIDWKENTIYKGKYHKSHETIIFFWDFMEKLNQIDLAKFLKFCTGSSRTPVDGFRNLISNRGKISKFCIESSNYDKINNVLPKAHTCFNRLELPIYSDKEELNKYLTMIINIETDGLFGLD